MVDYNLELLRVLIVDDNKHMRSLVRSILSSFGLRDVKVARDGAEAYKLLKSFPADIVICDWRMEPTDGMEFIRMIRTNEDTPNPYVPVIMLTGYTDVEHVVQARDSGVHEFLAKPVSADKLYLRIKAIIENERIFVKAGEYFGPDRRRREGCTHTGTENRKRTSATSTGYVNGVSNQDNAAATLNC